MQTNKIFLNKRVKYNRRITAKYLALYTENVDKKKCLITLTPNDGKLSTTLNIRRRFFKQLNKYKTNKKDGDKSIKYFSNIEFTSVFQSHLHIQVFYQNITPIEKAYNSIVNNSIGNTSQNSLSIARNHNLNFSYIIKDYLTTNLTTEKHKSKYSVKYVTSSRKSITDKVVRYLYMTLNFKTKNKYKELLELISKKKIKILRSYFIVSKIKNRKLMIRKIGIYYVIILKSLIIKKRGKKISYKIKRLIKNKKRFRLKC